MDGLDLFQAYNRHSRDCGDSPHISANAPNRLHSYFENDMGEQLIFVFDYEAEEGTLYHSDFDWEPQHVEQGRAPKMILDQAETMWLMACWMAAMSGLKARRS